jgi:hypothetical protein
MTAEVLNAIAAVGMIGLAVCSLWINFKTFMYLLDAEGVLYRIEKAQKTESN